MGIKILKFSSVIYQNFFMYMLQSFFLHVPQHSHRSEQWGAGGMGSRESIGTEAFLLCLVLHRSLSMLREMGSGEAQYFDLSSRNFSMPIMLTTEFFIDINIINHTSLFSICCGSKTGQEEMANSNDLVALSNLSHC